MGESDASKEEKKDDKRSETSKNSSTSSEVRRLSKETKTTVSELIKSEEVKIKAKEDMQIAKESIEEYDSKTLLERTRKANYYLHLENCMLADHLTRIMANCTGHPIPKQLEVLKEHADEDSEDTDSTAEKSRDGTSYSGKSRIWPRSSDYSPADSFSKPNLTFKKIDKQSSSGSRSKGYQSSLRSSINQRLDPQRPLDSEEKCDIVNNEIKLLKQSMKECQANSERILDDIKAMYDEACMKLGEASRDRSDFYREVWCPFKRNPSGKACAEVILKFFDDKMKNKSLQIKKIKEQNNIAQINILNIEDQVKNKKELSDVLHAVDFDRFTIQNQQLHYDYNAKSREYQKLKTNYLKASRAMASTRSQLSCVDYQNWSVNDSLSKHKPHLQHVIREVAVSASKQKFLIDDLHMLAVQEIHGAGQPHGLEYMQIRIKAAQLQKDYIDWKRKVELAELTAHELDYKVRKVQGFQSSKLLICE